MVVVLGDARGELDRDPLLVHTLLGLDLADQVAELAVQGAAAAPAAGQVDCAIGPVLGIPHEAAQAMVERPLAEIPGAPLLHDVALDYDDVVFFIDVVLDSLNPLGQGHFSRFQNSDTIDIRVVSPSHIGKTISCHPTNLADPDGLRASLLHDVVLDYDPE
jgi:hypothetical protein